MGTFSRVAVLREEELAMKALFSCRNCVHNCGQTLNLGPGAGFCLKHNSLLRNPDDTTCKYLHRKDLPTFVVEEGVREHAAEFAFFPALVGLSSKKPMPLVRYSEKFAWEQKTFAPLLNALAQYHKMKPHWIMVQSFTGGLDGLRAVVHASLVRHYLGTCETWRSSYRLVLGLLQEIDVEPRFRPQDIIVRQDESANEVEADAMWDVIFARLSGLQEYGWHAGLEELTWLTDSLNGALSDFDWMKLRPALSSAKTKWTSKIIQHAKRENVYFAGKSEGFEADEGLDEP